MKRAVFCLVLVSFACAGSPRRVETAAKPVAASFDATEVFTSMKSLVGEWKRKGDEESAFRIHFNLTANDTVLVERWLVGEREHSLTLYHLDGERLLATHYCPQGNQPRLEARSAGAHSVSFAFSSATNLASLASSHQHTLEFSWGEGETETVVRHESYRSAKGDEPSSLTLVRSAPESQTHP